jgi:hypothetical protein
LALELSDDVALVVALLVLFGGLDKVPVVSGWVMLPFDCMSALPVAPWAKAAAEQLMASVANKIDVFFIGVS